MNPATIRAAAKLNLIRILSSHPEGLSLEDLQKITGHKSITELKNELGELYMIEMYPYSPMDCVEIDYDGEKVKISLPIALDKTLPLSPDEWMLLRDIVSRRHIKPDSDENVISDSILSKINSVIPSGSWEPNQKIRSFLKNSIQNKNIISLSYWKRESRDKEIRHVQPWILWDEGDSYLLCYDLEKKGFRSYRLDCILSAEKTSEKIIDLPTNAKDWLNGFIQLVKPSTLANEAQAEVYCTDSSAYHLSQKLPMKDKNRSLIIEGESYFLFEVPIREENWFIATILGYGKSVLVHSPEKIKDKILARLEEGIINPA